MSSSSTCVFAWNYIVFADGDSGTPGSSGGTVIRRDDSVIKGGSIPKWRQVIAQGGNATTDLVGVRWTFVQEPAHLEHWLQYKYTTPPIGSRRVVLTGNILPLDIPVHGIPTLGLAETSAKNRALTRYYSHVNSVTTKFSGMVFTGELRESLAMIRHPARAFRNGISDYLSFLRRNAGRVTKRRRPSFVRETWLEYAFGWRPLINDIDNAIKAFYASKAAHPIFEMVKGTARDTQTAQSVDDVKDVGALHSLKSHQSTVEEVYVKYFGIYFSRGNGVPNSHAAGFHPGEFIPTVWELIPYSFLVDYFSNIGAILSSWSYRSLVNGWTARTIRRTFEQQAAGVEYKWTPGSFNEDDYFHGQSGSPGSALYKVVQVARVANAPLELPALELKVPGRWDQWVNIAALSKQLESTRRVTAR